MKGFPKNINNRQDLDHLNEKYPRETKDYLQKIVDNRSIWALVSEINIADGVEDKTHKVVTSEGEGDNEDVHYQYELVDNLSPINKFDFNTYDEVEEYVKCQGV